MTNSIEYVIIRTWKETTQNTKTKGNKTMKEITLKYAKPNRNGITTDYHEFLIHNVTPDGSWHLLKKEPWGLAR